MMSWSTNCCLIFSHFQQKTWWNSNCSVRFVTFFLSTRNVRQPEIQYVDCLSQLMMVSNQKNVWNQANAFIVFLYVSLYLNLFVRDFFYLTCKKEQRPHQWNKRHTLAKQNQTKGPENVRIFFKHIVILMKCFRTAFSPLFVNVLQIFAAFCNASFCELLPLQFGDVHFFSVTVG